MKEKYLLELGGENTELGKYEALELLKFQKYSPFLEKDYESIIVISTSKKIKKNIIARLSMTKRISRIIFTSNKENVKDILTDLEEINIEDLNFAIRQIGGKKLESEKTAILIGEKISTKNATREKERNQQRRSFKTIDQITPGTQINSQTLHDSRLQQRWRFR